MVDEKKIDIIKSTKPFKIFDIFLLVGIVAIIIVLIVSTLSTKGDNIEINNNGQVSTYSLSENRRIDIYQNNEFKLTVVIENSECYITDSTCQDKICMHGKIKNVHQMLVCAPFSITVRVIGGSDLDAVIG